MKKLLILLCLLCLTAFACIPSGGGGPGSDLVYDNTGPYSVKTINSTGPNNRYTLFMPQGITNMPAVTFGVGTFGHPWFYNRLLKHIASYGIAVIASNSMFTGIGDQLLDGIKWLVQEYPTDINEDALGAFGHSQGGGATIHAARDPMILCSIPIQPFIGIGQSNVSIVKGPMFIISGTNDTVVPPDSVKNNVYNPSPVPTIFGILNGATHYTPLSGSGMKGYMVAWFLGHLTEDQDALDIFYGDDGIVADENWVVERKNLK